MTLGNVVLRCPIRRYITVAVYEYVISYVDLYLSYYSIEETFSRNFELN